jgi:HD-GYP domain-containing protein (c-di-GMP phosphodiesterase class II)
MNMEKEILQLVTCLNGAVANSRLYTADHPQVLRYLERAHEQLQQVLKAQPEITFLIVDDQVVVDHQALTAKSPYVDQFVQMLKQSAIERLTFTSRIDFKELMQLVGDIASSDQQVVRSTPGIKLGKIRLQTGSAVDGRPFDASPEMRERLQALAALRQRSLDEVKDLFHQIRTSREISPLGLDGMVQGFLRGMLSNVNPLQMLASLKSADDYTFTHAINVCILTMAQAESLGIQGTNLRDIGIAASMHDAGKMFVPEEILNKPDKLSREEWHHMREHAAQGAQYLLRLEGIPKLAFLAALEHHIRYDGTGYPDLGRGWRPNIVSQMIAVADMFDAMRSRRPYKEPKPDTLIIMVLREESGTSFNPRLVQNFLKMIKA